MSFHLRRPSQHAIEAFLDAAKTQSLTYRPVGLALNPSAGYWVDAASAVIGRGDEVFQRARRALQQWREFELGWAEVFPKDAPIAIGTIVAVLARHLGIDSLNACRIVSACDTADEFSFAYGTLTDHAESGEEIFRVTHGRLSGEVRYEIRAVSRGRALLAQLGGPVARVYQARFRRDSVAAMHRAVADESVVS